MQLPCPYNYVLVNNHQSVVYTVLVDLNNTLQQSHKLARDGVVGLGPGLPRIGPVDSEAVTFSALCGLSAGP